ncbi:hypothetical protein V8F06_014596 [Rhypophila decipiens]
MASGQCEKLWEQVSNLCQESGPEYQALEFIPAGAYKRVMKKDVVQNVLGLVGDDDGDGLLGFVLTKAPKVFLITLRVFDENADETVKIRDSMKHFRNHCSDGFTDENLPVLMDTMKSGGAFPEWRWTSGQRRTFFDSQWVHLARCFKNESFNEFTLHPKTPLPFLKHPDGARSSEGASSTVRRAQIHQDHFNPPEGPDEMPRSEEIRIDVAIKKFNPSSEIDGFPGSFKTEADALRAVRNLQHPHIIPWIAAITRGLDHYLVFLWASGGNLRDLWNTVNPLIPDDASRRYSLFQETLTQFRGLIDALCGMHMTLKYRHGDIKPENILWFKDRMGSTTTGLLKIGDFGLAKQHNNSTVRRGPTSTRHTTLQYESPEADHALSENTSLSRLTDIWSLGCVMLEHLIWLVYGHEGLESFNRQLKENDKPMDSHFRTAPFYQKTATPGETQVRETVQKWIRSLKSHPLTKANSRGLLVTLVAENLLVTNPRLDWENKNGQNDNLGPFVKQPAPSPLQPGTRASAEELRDRLDSIIDDPHNHIRFFACPDCEDSPNDPAKRPSKRMKLETTDSGGRKADCRSLRVPGPGRMKLDKRPMPAKDYTDRKSNTWTFLIDREMGPIDQHITDPQPLPGPVDVCRECAQIDFGGSRVQVSYPISDMERRAPTCGLCRMLYKGLRATYGDELEAYELGQEGGKIVLESHESSTLRDPAKKVPVLSIIASPDSDPQRNKGTLSQRKNEGIPVSPLPKTFRDAVVVTRALEAKKMEMVFSDAYVVLAASCATGQNDGFPYPDSSRDRDIVAIATRPREPYAYSHPYRRERFPGGGGGGGGSGLSGQDGGGTGAQGPTVYICEMIDKFEADVVKGYLNTRAWVLQEHALAKRTIYFTPRQTYWECGKGVRCETGARMVNQIASFIGDPSFPSVALSGNRGAEIRWYQELYEQYSRLSLSHLQDRPIAIRGLESRLIAAFAKKYPEKDITGAYGVLHDGRDGGLLHRGLLWRRGSAEGKAHGRTLGLRAINFPPGHEDIPPSWSWMAYSGGIDFIKVPGGTVEWEPLDLSSCAVERSKAGGRNAAKTILAQAWEFRTPFPKEYVGGGGGNKASNKENQVGSSDSISSIVYDTPDQSLQTTGQGLKCVIVGREKYPNHGSTLSFTGVVPATQLSLRKGRVFYVIVVVVASTLNLDTGSLQLGNRKESPVYKRIGAGWITGSCILDLEQGGEGVAIV